MSDKYPTRTAILGKLMAMVVKKHGSAKGIDEPQEMLTRLQGLAILPTLTDQQIEEALARMVEAGEFAPPADADGK